MSSLVNTMGTRQQEEVNVVEGSTCNYFRPTWRPTSCAMATKVLQIASWVLVRHCHEHNVRGGIPIGSMGCVHTHQRMPTIEGWGNPSHVRNVVKKNGQNNQKVRKISQTIS